VGLVLQKQIESALEIFDAVSGPRKLPLGQPSVQAGITQLRPLHTLSHLFFTAFVWAIPQCHLQIVKDLKSTMNGEWLGCWIAAQKNLPLQRKADKGKAW